jgi:excisionase family DNA binding protein
VSDAPIIRPSELARFWRLHPKTVYTWIRDGRLIATRSPGNQFRVKVTDVRAFCERQNLPLPAFASMPSERVIVIGVSEATHRALKRALRPHGVAVECFEEAYRGLFAAVLLPPTLIALDGGAKGVDADKAVRALRATSATARVPVLVIDVSSAARCVALVRAGATRALARSERAGVAREALAMIARERLAPKEPLRRKGADA